jgi:hypothetical protein
MRLRSALLVAGASLLLVGVAAAKPERPLVLGVSWESDGKLAWLDARTLAPAGRRVDIGRPPIGVAARSPDLRTIALTRGEGRPELRFVDIRAMRETGRLRVQGTGYLHSGIWRSPDRLVTVRSGTDAEVLIVNPLAHGVLERRPLEGQVVSVTRAARRLVVLLAPKGAVGPAQLAVVDESGSVTTLALPRVEAGFTWPTTEREVGRHVTPGVAVDSSGRRAIVVTPDVLVEIDLEAPAIVRTHVLARRALAAASKAFEGWGRGAIWLRGDTVAVSGSTATVEGDRVKYAPTGVEIVDVRSGAGRVLDPAAYGATRVRDVLLTYGGSALRGYDLDGTKRFALLRGRDTAYVQTAGRWVYVGRDNSTVFTIVDARAGKVVKTARTAYPTIVLGTW